MTNTALITGATGQDGRYLIDLLCKRGYAVHAQTRGSPRYRSENNVEWHVGDPTDSVFLERLIAGIRPDEIYNLAAVSRPILSWSVPDDTARVNALLPQNICEVLLKLRLCSRLFQASSSDMFGDGSSELQDEQTHCEPNSPYGVAKLYAHRIIGAYRQQYGLHACCGIMFNHESPLRPLSFVSQKIACAAANASLGVIDSSDLDEGGQPILCGGKVRLGDLSVRRDFGFAGDYAEAMHAILQHSVPDDYVVGTGENHSIQEFCELAFRSVDLDWTDHVSVDLKLIRKTDNHYTRANPAKLRSVFNWQPKVGFAELVSTMVEAQIRRLRGGEFSRGGAHKVAGPT